MTRILALVCVLLPALASAQVSPFPPGVTPPIFGLPAIHGGSWSPTSLSLPASSCSAPAINEQGATTTGIAFTATPSILHCITGTAVTTLTGSSFTSTVPFLAPNGSASAPSYSFASDPNYGSYYNGSGAVVWSIAGSNALALASNGLTVYQSLLLGSTQDVSLSRGAAGVLSTGNIFQYTSSTNTSSGAAASAGKKLKPVTAIPDNTATDVFTVTVPNAAHSATIRVTFSGSLGAGGAIGANEATGNISYDIAVSRTAGVATVASMSSGYASSTAGVAGAATITVTGDLSSISGASSATQTFTIRVTIAHGSGSSTNHTCRATAEIINANASGITVQ